ncbi:MAG: PepSY domain-containing protein [Campylobacter sp.]|nr:PepSY domain-containing protein [Campylobacter sp.]
MLFKRNKFAFNLHLFLTFLSALPLIIILISGALVQYRSQIAGLINSFGAKLEKSDQKALQLHEILDKIVAQKGEFTFSSLNIPKDSNKAIRANIFTNDGEFKSYFVDQRNGQITGEAHGNDVARFLLSLHRNLAFSYFNNSTASFIGKHIVALSTLCFIVLVISGIWLYYPALKKRPLKALALNFKLKSYAFLYQLHSALGVWFALIMLLMALTGLYWSYNFVRNSVNLAFGVKSGSMMGHGHGGGHGGGMQKMRLNAIPFNSAKIYEFELILASTSDFDSINFRFTDDAYILDIEKNGKFESNKIEFNKADFKYQSEQKVLDTNSQDLKSNLLDKNLTQISQRNLNKQNSNLQKQNIKFDQNSKPQKSFKRRELSNLTVPKTQILDFETKEKFSPATSPATKSFKVEISQSDMRDLAKANLVKDENLSQKSQSSQESKEKSTFQSQRDVSHFMLDLHQGSYFGEIGKAIFSLICGLSVLFIITGFMMTFKRINKKRS